MPNTNFTHRIRRTMSLPSLIRSRCVSAAMLVAVAATMGCRNDSLLASRTRTF